MREKLKKYEDIMDLPYKKSNHYPHASNHDRAGQFAPFAALTGYESAINETARLTEKKIELEDEMKVKIDLKLRILKEDFLLKHQDVGISIIYFEEDKKKLGGRYVEYQGSLKKIDDYEKQIVFNNGKIIPISDIISLESENLTLFDD